MKPGIRVKINVKQLPEHGSTGTIVEKLVRWEILWSVALDGDTYYPLSLNWYREADLIIL